ncbi:MAG: hypothetical protein IIB63_03305 [Proteobacteria bacterium]|nr:hypothetical protein [Pseudomonadota bacterium]
MILAVAILAGAAPARAEVRADVEAGDKARHGGAFKEAAGLYTQAIRSGHIDGAALKINPGLAEALNGRGLVFAQKGHWIYQAALLYLGKASPKQVLDAARKGDPHKRREREAEAYFYIGQYYLVNGDEKAAAGYFRKVVDTGITRFYEYTGAEVELRRLARAR